MGNERPTLYIGVTNNPLKRVYEHKNKIVKGFTAAYDLNMLLYYEAYDRIEDAIQREKQLKKWNREWKINPVRTKNPDFIDLYSTIK